VSAAATTSHLTGSNKKQKLRGTSRVNRSPLLHLTAYDRHTEITGSIKVACLKSPGKYLHLQ
jgi:hypothetical protein